MKFLIFFSLLLSNLIGQEVSRLPLTRFTAGRGQKATLEFRSSATSYYLLRASSSLHTWTPRTLQLGNGGTVALEAPAADTAKKSFYIVEEIPRANPRDTDADGIDDVYELEHASILNPLNSTDASLDPNGDGITHLEEYLRLRGDVTSQSALKAVSVRRDGTGKVFVRYTSDLDHYYILEQSLDLQTWRTAALDLGSAALGELVSSTARWRG